MPTDSPRLLFPTRLFLVGQRRRPSSLDTRFAWQRLRRIFQQLDARRTVRQVYPGDSVVSNEPRRPTRPVSPCRRRVLLVSRFWKRFACDHPDEKPLFLNLVFSLFDGDSTGTFLFLVNVRTTASTASYTQGVFSCLVLTLRSAH